VCVFPLFLLHISSSASSLYSLLVIYCFPPLFPLSPFFSNHITPLRWVNEAWLQTLRQRYPDHVRKIHPNRSAYYTEPKKHYDLYDVAFGEGAMASLCFCLRRSSLSLAALLQLQSTV